jgi:hypothetical protein
MYLSSLFSHNICLSLTKLIEKKKDSLYQLQSNNKIPRSLRLKCDLTASPAYSEDTVFLELKEELQNETNSYINKGTRIMAAWAERNLQLLVLDRCSSIFLKALNILEGLTSFSTEILGTPTWPSIPSKYTTLFLLKLYLSNTNTDVSELSKFLELSAEQILLSCTKLTFNTTSDEDANTLIEYLWLTDVDMNDELQNFVIKEILLNFDQIIQVTTFRLWLEHKTKQTQDAAANKLK